MTRSITGLSLGMMLALAVAAWASPLPSEGVSLGAKETPPPLGLHMGCRFQSTETDWRRCPRLAWSLLVGMAESEEGFGGFAREDYPLLESIADLDRSKIEWKAVEPFVNELCALAEDDVRAPGRLRHEAAQAGAASMIG